MLHVVANASLPCLPCPPLPHPLHRPQLERVLHFRRLPGGLGYLPAWRSAWPLSGAEEAYTAELLTHRQRKMREGERYDELAPLPPGASDWRVCAGCWRSAGRRAA